ncbi:hypothetical protein SLEP1_g21856 [Rubroshorea leprosula]|uniref:Uncharacterized protein n=1 Tax=Rubroshorea leprosula TaxID=152421 RepID=A0AAV5JCS5_9ROSI|nr:hypothetical protein SLEP1_g21856 [Rubroshorea leprosula]
MILLLQQHFQLIAASRSPMFHPPAIPRASVMRKPIRPPAIDFNGFTINRYKMIQSDAFRPTSPGHSPGVGHDEPPGAYP